MQRSLGRRLAFSAAALFWSLAPLPALAGSGIDTPGLFQQPNLFAQPKLFTAPQPRVRTPAAPKIRPMAGSECRTLLGTCTLGRLEQVGDRCFCRTPKGAVQQGTTEIRRQGR
ncbi:hypothetical protein OSH10_21160 [Kaistia defluvii]|uniref:hypothetical protein n=1 Tax=Kaistia defluvii TaxID=410841 RepID=UPI0022549FA5|nr:hypothetical protein [Kaistia defluvii]MCX5520956.1 hypothetical protein [Kaistia defluvii]